MSASGDGIEPALVSAETQAMLARHATLVAERRQTHSGTRLAVQRLAAFVAHDIR
jgi:hypothetical protein